MRATLAWFSDRQEEIPEYAKYAVTGRCPQCGREHITIFRLRHISDSFFARLGEFFRYAEHERPDGATCENSDKPPEWGGPARIS